MQEGHLVAFKSPKLNDMGRPYSLSKQEMMTVVTIFVYGCTTSSRANSLSIWMITVSWRFFYALLLSGSEVDKPSKFLSKYRMQNNRLKQMF